MKSLLLSNPRHIQLEAGFREWLSVLGYSSSIIESAPNHLREYLHYQETNGQKALRPTEFFFHLEGRLNVRRKDRGLSVSYLQKYRSVLKLYGEYLVKTDQGGIDLSDVRLPEGSDYVPEVLSRKEINALYEATEDNELGLRDRAMLSVYYGCGLRRSEGVCLDIGDVDHKRGLLYVDKGKGNKSRYVPMGERVCGDLRDYEKYSRPYLNRGNIDAYFISVRGTRPQGQSLYLRLKRLLGVAGIDREVGLHSLRHSIATHLLECGVRMEDISLFLGHSSQDSTQLYTHVASRSGGPKTNKSIIYGL